MRKCWNALECKGQTKEYSSSSSLQTVKSFIIIDQGRGEHRSHVPHVGIVGSIIYAMICTRPKILDVVNGVSRIWITLERSIGKQ